MIVDVHAHCWPSLDCFSPSFQADARRMRVNAVNLVSRYEEYRAATAGDALDLFIDAAAATLDLPVEPAWKPAVKANLAVTLRFAALYAAFPLPDDAEPAPVFVA